MKIAISKGDFFDKFARTNDKLLFMKSFLKAILLLIFVSFVIACSTVKPDVLATFPDAEFWLTTADQSALMTKQSPLVFTETSNSNPTITIDDSKTFQEIDGFGYCLTGGSATLINNMEPKKQKALLKELFETNGNAIGVSYLRVSIGASDLDPAVFSYDDLHEDEFDPTLSRFSLDHDKKDLIPILKKILAINPNIKILGSPWSAPTWMKDNGNSKGGSLLPHFYDSYAQYFVKYINGMKAKGIAIDAITIQNEPLHPGNNPSMYMEAKDQAIFIKKHLGPAFAAAKIKTKIIVYDHNCDKPQYPLEILNDAEANKYVDGSAFHLYSGEITALSNVHDAHPDKNVYFTEQWTGGPGDFPNDLKWNTENLIIGATRNWSRTVLQWNLAADPQYKPFTPGGCTTCMGAITIDASAVKRNPAYYVIAQASKFVRPGSFRIASNNIDKLPNVAFKTPEGKKVLIVLNTGTTSTNFTIRYDGKNATAKLNSGAVGTFVW
ncbi:MAG: glycoside hydrolase family 30 beta sandwich domain-containing protein [Flavobacterium sp.]|nr:glycoside hydrolase family 30 beta sandwich domain-containing protein [Flavobacterium sp.]